MSGVERAMKVRLATLVAAGALLVGLGPAGAERAEAAPNPFFGVMAQMPMTEADFDRMAKGRLGTYRMPIDWGTVDQQEPANMNWEWVDRVVGLTAERGITVLPNFHDTPEWIAPDRRRVPVWNGEVIGRWQAFLRQAVTRYGSNGTFWLDHPDIPRRPIRFWQIWNEPNIRYWAWPVSPARYTKLLRISARTIRNVDPTAKIVLAGLYSRPPDGTGISAGRYLHRLYRQPGFRNSFDVAAIHPYANNTNRSVRRTFPIRRGMNRHRQRGQQIMAASMARQGSFIPRIGNTSYCATGFGSSRWSGSAGRICPRARRAARSAWKRACSTYSVIPSQPGADCWI